MPLPTVDERTRAKHDPIRNFKYQVDIYASQSGGQGVRRELAKIGFTSVEGLSMATDVTAYREGGWNTNPHKLPGQTDFSPVTFSSGVFYDKSGMWDAAKQMFSVQWGEGTIGMFGDFRFDAVIRVLDHPVTQGAASGVRGNTGGTVLGFKIYNGWVANVAFGGLNAGDNSVLIHNMTVHHEGLGVGFHSGSQSSRLRSIGI